MPETTIERLLRLDAASSALGVQLHSRSNASISLKQDVIPGLADHRGTAGLSMISVLLDAALGTGAYLGASSEPLAVVANMSVSMAHPIPSFGTIVATGSPIFRDTASGTALSRAELRDREGRILVTAKARTVEVKRPLTDAAPALNATEFPYWNTEVNLSKSTDGISALTTLIEKSVSIGSLASAYGLRLESIDGQGARASIEPHEWMLNGLGSIQGGVLVGAMALITELTGQSLTCREQEYSLADIDVDLLRSPRIADGNLMLRASTVKRGRRLCLIDADLETQSGQPVARSRGTVILTQGLLI